MLPQCRVFKSFWYCRGGHIRTVPPCSSMRLPNLKVSLDDTTSSCKPCLHCRVLGETLSAWGRVQPASGNALSIWDNDPGCIQGHAAKLLWLPPSIPVRVTGSLDAQTVLQALAICIGGLHRGWCNGMVSAQLKGLHGPELQRIMWDSNISSPLQIGDSGTLQGERPLPSQPFFLSPDSRCYTQPFLLQNDNSFH